MVRRQLLNQLGPALLIAMGVAALFAAAAEPYAAVFAVLVALWGFASGMTWAISANAGLVAASAMAWQ